MIKRLIVIGLSVWIASFSSVSVADCLGAGYSRGNDPCDTMRASRQNSFGDHNVYQPPKTREQELAEKRRMAEGRANYERLGRLAAEIDAKKEAEADAIRKRQAYEREMAMRQEDINARNRQAAATEAAANAAARAAESAAAAANAAGAPRTLNCFAYGGGFSTCK